MPSSDKNIVRRLDSTCMTGSDKSNVEICILHVFMHTAYVAAFYYTVVLIEGNFK